MSAIWPQSTMEHRQEEVVPGHWKCVVFIRDNPFELRIYAARIVRDKLGPKCPAIFALAAEALEGDKQRFLDLGFDGYLSKPLQIRTLKDMLKTVNSSTGLAVG
jgi:DNA-binding response OmpR family regulator